MSVATFPEVETPMESTHQEIAGVDLSGTESAHELAALPTPAEPSSA